MKTNEQMIEDLIKRKEIYDKKQAVKRRRFALVSAALAIILLVSSIPVIAFVTANKKAPAPPEVTAEAATDKQTETDGVTVTEEQSETTAFSGLDVTTHSSGKLSGEKKDSPNYFEINRTKISGEAGSETPLFDKPLSPTICLHEEIKEYEISIKRTEIFTDVKAYLIVIPSVSIDLLSGDLNYLDFETNDTVRVTLKFKYKDGYTNGRIYYYIYSEEDGQQFYSEIDDHITKGGLGEDYSTFIAAESLGYFAKLKYSIYGGEALCFAEIKGYDFEGYDASASLRKIYCLAAEHFGDVDGEGLPLFLSDPYMPEYFDSPDCYIERNNIEKPFTDYTNHTDTTRESTRGE